MLKPGAVLCTNELQDPKARFATRWGPQPQCGLFKAKRYQTATVKVNDTAD